MRALARKTPHFFTGNNVMQFRNALWAATVLAVGMSRCATVFGQAATQPSAIESQSVSESPPATQPSAIEQTPNSTRKLGKVVVTSDLDADREQIAPSLGAVTYSITPKQIQTIPGGENAPFQ
jgi:hypothetical protein